MTPAVRHLVARMHIFYGFGYVGDKSLTAVLYRGNSFSPDLHVLLHLSTKSISCSRIGIVLFFPHSSDPSAGPCCKSLQLKFKVPRNKFFVNARLPGSSFPPPPPSTSFPPSRQSSSTSAQRETDRQSERRTTSPRMYGGEYMLWRILRSFVLPTQAPLSTPFSDFCAIFADL